MSNSSQTREAAGEEVRLNLIAGAGDEPNNNTYAPVLRGPAAAASCSQDKNHRKLAIGSIICGLSCIGIKALIYSVQAEMSPDPETAAALSQRARKFGIISIVTWVCILVLTPVLIVLGSYLLTLQD